ncbi:MAG: hypothetical protein WCP68_03010 [Enhydrobacter sp.]
MSVHKRQRLPLRNAIATNWPGKVPAWTIVAFCTIYLAVFLPCIIYVVGIHNDYEMIWYKAWSLLHNESTAMFALGRPIAALLTNLTILPAMEISDFRVVRLFSIATTWVIGAQLIIICVCHLEIRARDAVVIALAVLLVPSFLYSVLAAAAWAPHLTTIFFALYGYSLLSRTNIQVTSFHGLLKRKDYRALLPQFGEYLRLRQVILAIVFVQLAFYDYPPQAMILACLPVATVLFSSHPPTYRLLLAIRDLAFLAGNLVIYFVTTKLLYLPVVRLFVHRFSEAWLKGPHSGFETRMAESYRYAINSDPGELLRRLKGVLRVSGDLWFLPQLNIHDYVGVAILLVLATLLASHGRRGRSTRLDGFEGADRLRLDGWMSSGVVAFATVFAGFLAAASAVLVSGGGFVSYRTIAMPIAVACIVAVFMSRYLAEFVTAMSGASPLSQKRAGDWAMATLVAAAAIAIVYANYLTMRMARNEHAYFKQIMREVVAGGAQSLVVVDPRPFTLPEDHPAIFDQAGRAVVPYELGCFTGYCLQTDAIFRIIATELGSDPKSLSIYTVRGGDPWPGISCEYLQSPTIAIPPSASEKARTLIRNVRWNTPAACFTYDLKWHNAGLDLMAHPEPANVMWLPQDRTHRPYDP